MKTLFLILFFAIPGLASESQDIKEIGKNVTKVASALRAYSNDHQGILPKNLRQLVPKYLNDLSELEIPLTSAGSGHQDYSTLFFSSSGFQEGDGQSFIALMSDRASSEGRYVIDAGFQVWWIGEARLRELLIGPPSNK